ncbi:response regulator [Aquibacillus halophilus]|uniref:Response regulator n=1 Tax=Aquibacillus halophilus TaxID=930132 RepID=A0A6A8DAL4_9BACI|nr:response regulator transcription factor [Aquibacillus halophilus]MRH42793.1 response regulator [Aquibacillus halophilus]
MINKVFLVDDDRFVRKGLKSIIDWESCGYEVCAEADNGEDALEYIKHHTPDLVVTDIRMPVLDGLQLIKEVSESLNPKPSFIIISGYSDFKYAQQAVKYGVHDFILKPVDKEEFEKTLQILSEKLKREKIMTRARENMIATSTLENILTGKQEEPLEHNFLKRLNVSYGGPLTYLIIEVNKMIVDVSKLQDMIMRKTTTEEENESLLIRDHGQGSFGLLVSDRKELVYSEDIELFAEDLQKRMERQLDKEVSVFVGKTVNAPSEIKESYETAKLAAQFKYVKSDKRPIFYQDVENESINYIELDQKTHNLLMEQIEEYNSTTILQTIDEIINEFKTKEFARDAVKTSINRFVHEIVKTIKTLEGNEQDLSTLPSMLHWSDHPYTLEQIKDMFSEFIIEASKLISQLNKDNVKGNIHKIKRYIDTNYKKNLTLKQIANHFYMNPVYMGQLFKKTYGVYFKDYFLQVRINEAKKMLRQTDLRIYEIAENVGFSNPDYFVTQFEKTVGATPTKYRNKVTDKFL